MDSTCVISSPNHMFDHLLDSSGWVSNIGFGEDIAIIEFKKRTLSGALYICSVLWQNYHYFGIWEIPDNTISVLLRHPFMSIETIICVKITPIDATRVILSPNPMFDHLLESSQWDDSNKWSNTGFF